MSKVHLAQWKKQFGQACPRVHPARENSDLIFLGFASLDQGTGFAPLSVGYVLALIEKFGADSAMSQIRRLRAALVSERVTDALKAKAEREQRAMEKKAHGSKG